jgi:hypothetical protein
MLKRLTFILLVLALLVGLTQPARAALNAVSPDINPNGNYPVWYQDTAGIALVQCLNNPTMCILPIAPPFAFPSPYPDESFYFSAAATAATAAGSADYGADLEGAFSTGAVPVDPLVVAQVVFSRIRIRIDVPPPGGNYRVIHPYGVLDFPGVVPGTRAINTTVDVGVAAGIFTGALAGDIGPFLHPSATPGGAPDPPIVVPGIPPALDETFIGDPNVLKPVTGSPFGTNFLRVEGPGVGGIVGGVPVNFVQVDDFGVMGQLFTGGLPTPLSIQSATYSRTAAGIGAVDVVVASSPFGTVTFSGTGLPAGEIPMTPTGAGTFFARVGLTSGATVPANIIVTATMPGTPNTPTSLAPALVDKVTVTRADYDNVNQRLIIQAQSSDRSAAAPSLSVAGFGAMIPNRIGIPTLVKNGVFTQPPTVNVTSSAGGATTAATQFGVRPERVDVILPIFRTKSGTWLLRGHTTEPGSLIRIFNSPNLSAPRIGTAIANEEGLWQLTLRGAKGRRVLNATKRISVSSSGGGSLKNKRVFVLP